jgi:hypothetical protein
MTCHIWAQPTTCYSYDHLLRQLQGHHVSLRSISGPPCRTCGWFTRLFYVQRGNANHHDGRPYFACARCKMGQGWGTWADTKGVEEGNPPCFCGWSSRVERVGVGKWGYPRRWFLKCAVGACRFYAEFEV